jgi:hypothetical protein
MQEELRLDNSVRNGHRGRPRFETQIGGSGTCLSLPEIVGSAVGGWTPRIGSQSDKTIKRMGATLKTTYIQSPRRNTVRGLGGLLDKVKPEPGK